MSTELRDRRLGIRTPTVFEGARWSSAVRCIARAEYQALGIKGDPEATAMLTDAFARGVNAADNWVQDRQRYHEAVGDTFRTEVEVPWGPNDMWTGHADAVIIPQGEPGIVVETYHSAKGAFIDVKALQAAFYADRLTEVERPAEPYRAMLVALNTSKQTEDGGFETTPYPVDVEGKLPEVRRIIARVALAYAEGEVNPEDRISDTPAHAECKHCPFREHCWADYVPPRIQQLPEHADLLERLALAQSNAAHLRAASEQAADDLRDLKALVRPYVGPGRSIAAAGIHVTRTPTAPRKSFRITDYLKAGHELTPTMAPFARESEEPGERWSIRRIDP